MQLVRPGLKQINFAALQAAAVAPGSPSVVVAATGASGTAPRVTTTGAVTAGQLVVAFVKSSAAQPTGFTDGLGNTYTANTGTGTSTMRLITFRSVTTNAIPIGTSIGPNYGSASAADVIMMVFPAATSFDNVATAGSSATGTSPTITLASLANATEIATFAFVSNGGLSAIDSAVGWPSGYTLGGSVEAGGFGTRVYWKNISGTPTYSEPFTPTGHTNVAYSLHGLSMVR